MTASRGSQGADLESYQVPCALVAERAGGRPELVVVIFHSAGEAEEFAARHGIDDWTVAPVAFGIDMDRKMRERRQIGRAG